MGVGQYLLRLLRFTREGGDDDEYALASPDKFPSASASLERAAAAESPPSAAAAAATASPLVPSTLTAMVRPRLAVAVQVVVGGRNPVDVHVFPFSPELSLFNYLSFYLRSC